MKRKIRIATLMLICILMMLATGCGVKENEVFSVEDMAGKKIGVQLGTTGDSLITMEYGDDEAGTSIERYKKGTDAIQSLKQGKVDCVVIDEEPAQTFLEKNEDLKCLDIEYANEEYAIAVSKDNTELRDKINGALLDLQEEGTLDRIMANYTGDETKGTYPYESPADVDRSNGKLVMATNAAFEPYEYYKGGEVVGIDVDMAQAIADKLGMELEIIDIDFDAIINAVQSGKADIGVAGMTVTEERLQSIDFTNTYAKAKQLVIVRSDKSTGGNFLEQFVNECKLNFIDENRYEYILKGLGNTIIISLLAVVVGTVIGFIVAIIRSNHDRTGHMKFANALCKIYLTVIRGTPTMLQLLIIYYVIFASVNVPKIVVAFVAFGLNSGAYVAEIVRSGIMAVDQGQFEAGRSLGLNYSQTMRHIVMPQAFKNVLPALGNEFIVLLKETSISGYIGLTDLTHGGNIIRGITYSAMMPLLAVAIIYLILVMGLSYCVGRLERRLRANER